MTMYGELLLLLLLLFILPLLVVSLVLGIGKKEEERLKCKLPPGPPRLPVIGNLHQLGEKPHRTLWELSKQYGPLMHLQLGKTPCVVISSAQMAEEVLKTHDLTFCSRPVPTSWKRLTYDFKDVAFSPYSATWRELRKIIVLGFLSTRKVEGFQSVRKEEIERTMNLISSQVSLLEPINLSKLLRSLSNDITCRVAFGKRFHTSGPGTQENIFYCILEGTEEVLVDTFIADYLPWANWVDVLAGRRARLEKNFAELDAIFQEVIEAHADHTRRPEDEEDFVDVLLRLQKEDAYLTDDHVKGLLMNVVLGGTDTSSATLEYAMAELVRNPNAMLKAQEEVRGAVGKKGKVEEGDISRLNYLKCIVKETLRLHPVVPLLVPHETMGHININGYDILPKTRVLVNAWAIGREMSSWEKPDEFIPERFVDGTIDFRGHDFQLIPFGAGRRICPGLTFGITMVEVALANLLYAFDWEAPKWMGREGINLDEGTGITVHLKNSLHLKPPNTSIKETKRVRFIK